MGRFNSRVTLKLPFICSVVFLLSISLLAATAFTFTASVGRPYHGRLQNGIAFPTQFQGYYLRDPERSYATPEAIGTVLDAIETVRAQYPDTCDLFIGDFSRQGGGGINMHRSHQNGRDADLGMYAKDNRALDTFVPMNEENLDVAKTWCFVESMLRSQHVQYLFVDRRIQRLLHDYALSGGGDPTYLETLFGNSRNSIIQHVRGHYDHIHVRFYTPWSTMAARVSEEDEQQRTVVEMAQQAYLPKKVNYYVKGSEYSLEALAQSFGVNQKDLCRWNQMHLNDVLTPGACLVFYKRGFELEPVHLARSLQPDSIPDSPGIQLASAPSSGSMQDVPTIVKYSSAAGRPASASSYIYTAHRGDTLEKVARRAGIDIGTLCALNGLQPRSGVKPGQRIKLVGATPSSGHANGSRPGTARAVNIVSRADSKAARGYVPAVYTAERHDTLSKIAQQQGIDLNALCQINGLKKNSALQPGQKIKLFGPGTAEKNSCSVAVMNASMNSKQTQAASNTLQANMKPVKESKPKADSTHQKKTTGIQKTSSKSSSAGTSALPAKAEKNPKDQSTK
jgi:LysM repeat protein/murein endopeptidase